LYPAQDPVCIQRKNVCIHWTFGPGGFDDKEYFNRASVLPHAVLNLFFTLWSLPDTMTTECIFDKNNNNNNNNNV
jgi:hypothetical protein